MADVNKHIDYSLADIQRYLQGSMSAKEMHDVERAALEDPFLADALEGYSGADMQQAREHLQQIDTAVRERQADSKVVPLFVKPKNTSWQVAASVLLLVGMSVITYFIITKKTAAVTVAKIENPALAPQPDSAQALMRNAVPRVPSSVPDSPVNKKAPASANVTLAAKSKNKKPKQSAAKASSTADAEAYANAPYDSAVADTNSNQSLSEVVITTARTNRIKQQPGRTAKRMLHDSASLAGTVSQFNNVITDSIAANANEPITVTGFATKRKTNAEPGKSIDTLKPKERPFLLSDIEVINIGNTGKRATDTAALMPQGGWQSFKEYVAGKLHEKYDSTAVYTNRYTGAGLELEFSINEAGDPYDFKVLQSPDTQTANEAITAIKDGPKWLNKDKNSRMRVRVNYK